MTVSYRNKLPNYMSDLSGKNVPVGSITPVLVDSYSTASSGLQSPEYAYNGYLYCDGRTLNIRDYPQLYTAIGNTYGGSTEVSKTQSSNPGGIRRYYWVNNKAFFNIYRDPAVNSLVKLPYPYGVNFRFVSSGNGLGSLPSNTFQTNVFYSTAIPSEDVSAYVPNDGTEFAYEIVFPENVDVGTLPQTDINITSGVHPNVLFNKGFLLRDWPHNVGTFDLPDYRDRIIVGYGAVNGDGSPTIENSLVNAVGQIGGSWYISKNNLIDGGVFFSVGDVRTRGYTSITSDILTYITGEVSYQVGPLDDYVFNRPIEHYHNILSSEPDESAEAEFSGVPTDQYAVLYAKTRANIIPFEPEGANGLALGHSHGLIAEALNDPRMATYGNTDGIGGIDPTEAPSIDYDVNDPFLTATVQYSGTALISYGGGNTETGGFSKPAISNAGDRYVAFGTPGSSPFSSLQTNRSVSYEVDLTLYEKIYVFAIMGNDGNGGERVNNIGEGLYLQWPDGSSSALLPSGQEFNTANGITGNFQAYDSAYAYWRQSEVDIPAQYRTSNVRFTLRQTVVSVLGDGTTNEQQNPGSDPNGYDMIGIQAIGFREGIPDELPQDAGIYPVTGSRTLSIISLTYDSANGYVIASTLNPHGYEAGTNVTISGASPAEYNGTFEIISDNLGSDYFSYIPDPIPSSSPAVGAPVVKISTGSFRDVTETPAPRVYPVNDITVVGGKTQFIEIPGTGVTFQTYDLLSSGSISTTPVPASEGTVTKLEFNLVAPGGGGADSDTDGGDAGYAYATFPWKGNTYTIYAYGGQGGTSGNNGGAGGPGGSYSIPSALLNDPDFEYSLTEGQSGQSGGGSGSSNSSTSGGGDSGVIGSGGDGSATAFTTTSTDPTVTYTSSGSWTVPTPVAGEVSRTITIRAAGAGGGGGNGNANSGCSSPAIGGSGGAGALITATVSVVPSFYSFVIGSGGSAGVNARDGFANGAGYEYDFPNGSAGGGGAATGGNGGSGAYGNGATAGGGGGATGVYHDGGNAVIGAGGGGGGGGSGGGFNGGSVTDGCYAGGNNQGASTNLNTQSSALDFNDGASGTYGGCTAGGGGGGGGGAGPQGQANGGTGGQAGVGHNGNGGGTGGQRGESAFRSDYVSASWSTAGNGGGPGSSGGSGYVSFDVTRQILYYGNVGGAGGQGCRINFTLRGTSNANVAVSAGLQSPGGNGGSDSTSGQNGYVEVRYGGSQGGGQIETAPTNPEGVYYEGTPEGIPQGTSYDGDIWESSTASDMIPTIPGLGTGNNTKFALPSGNGVPTYGGLVTKYLPFTGEGTREYIIGPIDMRNVNRLRFLMIRGSNFNGGATPEEDIIAYWRRSDSQTTSLLDTVITTSGSASWANYDINIPEADNIRDSNILIILRQTRNSGQDDNATNTEDNYGLAAFTTFFDEVTTREFTPSVGNTISGIDYVSTTVNPNLAGLTATDGLFEMSSSTPISTTALVSPESNIPLITRYHRVKYLIKSY